MIAQIKAFRYKELRLLRPLTFGIYSQSKKGKRKENLVPGVKNALKFQEIQ